MKKKESPPQNLNGYLNGSTGGDGDHVGGESMPPRTRLIDNILFMLLIEIGTLCKRY